MQFRTLKELDSSEGTVQLVDENATHAPDAEHVANKDVVLVPQPSSNPNDPLRWAQWKKIVVFINVCIFAFLGNAGIGGLNPGFEPIAIEFRESPTKVSGLITWPILVLGCSNFFWTPMALWIGKRPVFITATLIFFISNLWAMKAKSFQSLLASVIVGSFATGSMEALGAAIVNDLFFLHERGAKMGIYIIFLSLGSSVGPLCGGFIIEYCSWQWFKRIMAIFSGVNFLSVVLFAPETRFSRVIVLPTSSGLVQEGQHVESTETNAEKLETVAVHNEFSDQSAVKPQSYLQSLNPWSGFSKDASLFKIFFRPFPVILYPANLFATISYAIALAWIVIIASNISFLLSGPPWTFGPSIIGLVNLPTMIGNFLGAVATGWPSDKYAQWKARRSGGIFQPESRLIFLWLPGLLVPAGCLMYGYGAQDHMSWVIIFIGAGCVAVGLTAIANVGMTYAVESYYPIAAESLLMINGLKNIIAYGMSYTSISWVASQGNVNTFGTIAGLTIAVLLFSVPLAYYGQRIRHYTSTHLRLILD